MARTRDEAQHAKRREGILLAAARLFKTRGFHRSRTEDICVEAGISPGSLFRHFPDKQAIIMAIAEREFAGYRSDVESLATRDGIERLGKLSPEALVELLKPKVYELGVDSWLELSRDPETRRRLRTANQELRDHLSQRLKSGQNEGWVRKALDCDGAASLMLAMFGGLTTESELGLAPDATSAARAMGDLVRRFILS
jgi:AcrR family transcriptional regulator